MGTWTPQAQSSNFSPTFTPSSKSSPTWTPQNTSGGGDKWGTAVWAQFRWGAYPASVFTFQNKN